jgi:hypothetical protein
MFHRSVTNPYDYISEREIEELIEEHKRVKRLTEQTDRFNSKPKQKHRPTLSVAGF